MEKENNPQIDLSALPPIPKGKRAVWVDDTLKLVDAPAEDKRPITERVKTFDDALNILGENNPLVKTYYAIDEAGLAQEDADRDVWAYLKLRIIAAALNEGWEPQFTGEECRYYPWFYLYTKDEIEKMTEERKEEIGLLLWGGDANHGSFCGLGCVHSYAAFSYSSAYCGSRLAVKSSELAKYFGRQFMEIWAEYCFRPGKYSPFRGK